MSMTDERPEPIRGDMGTVMTVPRNIELERQNSDLLVPPFTDSRLNPNQKLSFFIAHTRVEKGGWTREVTQRDLPVATTITGVQFGPTPGGYAKSAGTSSPSGPT